jgi:hypothetical protein
MAKTFSEGHKFLMPTQIQSLPGRNFPFVDQIGILA